MKAIIAIALSIMLPLLGLNGVASAQSAVAVYGTIDAVDCQSDTVVVTTATGQQTFYASDNAYATVDATDLPLCSLDGYVGAPATVWVTPSGNQFVATAVNVTGPVAVAPVAAEVVTPLPIWGTVLGTVVVGGLLYLSVYAPDEHYYLYPYYGGYYRDYYHAGYRRYTGYYPASALVVTVALPIVGAVLGTVLVNGNPYLVSRDAAGHVYRYPYWGPYRQHYYRPTYRAYTGPNVSTYVRATVRQGDPHWDAPAHTVAVALHHAPAGRNVPQHQPQPAANNQPAHQPQPAYHPANNNPPAHQPQPAYHPANNNPPAHQPQPAYHPANNNPPAHQPQPAAHPANNNPPAHQPQPAYHPANNNPPAHQPQPAAHPANNPPAHQPQPAYHPANNNPPAHQPQPAYHPANNPPAHQPQPAYHPATTTRRRTSRSLRPIRHNNPPAHQPQPADHPANNPPAHQPQPAAHPANNPPAHQPQQSSRQQCGNQQGQSNQCPDHGK